VIFIVPRPMLWAEEVRFFEASIAGADRHSPTVKLTRISHTLALSWR